MTSLLDRVTVARGEARLSLLALCGLCVALVLVGCGGSKHAKVAGGANVCESPATSLPPSYEPSGDVIADSGFRPDTNGFGTENYGNCGQQNLNSASMSNLFGEQVCLSGSGPNCQLDPSAQKWMETTNEQMAGGHCMGFSVAALRFFSGNLDPANYGADDTFGLNIKDNPGLQSLIAAGWVYQFLPTVANKELTGPPNAILNVLIDALKQAGDSNRSSAYPSGQKLYTIKIFNDEGGHAVTPYAVEDKGDGQYAVLTTTTTPGSRARSSSTRTRTRGATTPARGPARRRPSTRGIPPTRPT